ncbi:hypothetical protein ACVXHB_22420 [Escherichia coli]
MLTEMAKAIPLRRLAICWKSANWWPSSHRMNQLLTGTQNVIDGGSTLPETVSVGIDFTSVFSRAFVVGFRLIPFSTSKSPNGV